MIAAGCAISIEISPGELLDRISILRLKCLHARNREYREQLEHDLRSLERARSLHLPPCEAVDVLAANLTRINAILWRAENAVRGCERRSDFGPRFITLARRVYRLNDRRAKLKRDINIASGSASLDQKIYRNRRP